MTNDLIKKTVGEFKAELNRIGKDITSLDNDELLTGFAQYLKESGLLIDRFYTM